ncbi:hypothetical protein V3471_08215 [Flavobacterium oreochromis]|uniref:hypothetical protein n=1 Tax=Flavobacterium oreochromis TaxID=2906078 RepID=UPI00385C65F8
MKLLNWWSRIEYLLTFIINLMGNIIKRIQSPTPKFFKVLRNVGLVLLSVSSVIAAAPIALPAVVVTMSGYVAVAGGILSAVSQLTVPSEEKLAREQELGKYAGPGSEINTE